LNKSDKIIVKAKGGEFIVFESRHPETVEMGGGKWEMG
jgi:hypothetical protein